MLAGGGALALALAVAACSSFGTTADPGVTPEGDSALDAGTSLEGSVADGALRPEGSAASGPCAAAPCVFDFEEGKLPAAWAPAGNIGTLLVTDGMSTSGTKALDVSLSTSEPAFLVLDLGRARRAAVTASVLVLTRGTGEVDFFGLCDKATAEPGLYLVHSGSSIQFAVEPPLAGVELIAQSFSSYTAVRLEVDLVARTYSYSLGANPPKSGTLAKNALGAASLYVLLGAPYAMGVTQPWHVRFDDVKVELF